MGNCMIITLIHMTFDRFVIKSLIAILEAPKPFMFAYFAMSDKHVIFFRCQNHFCLHLSAFQNTVFFHMTVQKQKVHNGAS